MKQKALNNLNGFSLVEMMTVITLTLILFAAGGRIFSSGVSTWDSADSHVKMQENLRQTLDRLASEIRLSNTAPGEGSLQIIDGAGLDSSDAIKFSIPVICASDANLMENDAVAHWGAPLTWGCKQSSCMDANNSCSTIEYKYVYYVLNADGRLERRVLDGTSVPVSVEDMGVDLVDLQFSVNSDGRVVTINATVEQQTQKGRVLTAQASVDVYLRNCKGGESCYP